MYFVVVGGDVLGQDKLICAVRWHCLFVVECDEVAGYMRIRGTSIPRETILSFRKKSVRLLCTTLDSLPSMGMW